MLKSVKFCTFICSVRKAAVHLKHQRNTNTQTNNIMKTQVKSDIKKVIETLAKEEKITFLEACSAIQGAAAKMNHENIIKAVAEIKEESDEYKALMKKIFS